MEADDVVDVFAEEGGAWDRGDTHFFGHLDAEVDVGLAFFKVWANVG